MAWTSMEQTIPSWRERTAALVHQAAARLSGPGGYYNIGNAFGLGMGIALQIESTPAGHSGLEAAADAATSYLVGNPAATALTLGTAVFFWSGEMYHRAWANGAPPNPVLNRRGELSSGIGALILFAALLSLGHVMLAVTAGLLHALGKFGSAWKWRPLPGWRATWPDCFRTLVLASRVPVRQAGRAAGRRWRLLRLGDAVFQYRDQHGPADAERAPELRPVRARMTSASTPLSLDLPPMEAEAVDDLPSGPGWQYEPKYDGFRCLAHRRGGRVHLQSKNQKPLERYFPEVSQGLEEDRRSGLRPRWRARHRRWLLREPAVAPASGREPHPHAGARNAGGVDRL